MGWLFGTVIGIGVGLMVGLAWSMRRDGRPAPGQAEDSASDAEGHPENHAGEVAAMTAGLAHEIKNPLSTIGMNAQLLDEAIADLPADNLNDPHELTRIRRRIGTLVRETERLRGILSDFLDFAGEIRLNPVRADLNTVVEELGDFFLPETEKAGVRMRLELADRPVPINADVPHLKQALLNLMINATQAMANSEAGGRELILRVEASHAQEDGQARVAAHVIDTGPGMDPEQLGAIFTPYFTTKAGGTGLGLPTAKRIIDEHGGELIAFSEEGTGTDFQVRLPVDDRV